MSALLQSLERAIPPATPSPSLHHLLHSNDPPLESEHDVANGIISTAKHRLADVEEEMRRMEDDLDQLRRQRDDAQRVIDGRQAVVSPTRQLSPTLIAENALRTLSLENDDDNIISTAERRLLHVEEEMRRLEDALGQLRCQQDEIMRILDSHKAIVSPVRRLPRELIATIALHTLSLENRDKKLSDWPVAVALDTRSSPWKLGQLCRIWRDAVLSFPELWSSVRFHYHDIPKSSNLEYLLDTLLQRSKDLPLSIIFTERHGEPKISPLLMRLLVGQCHRWKNVSLTLGLHESFEQLAVVRGHLPHLERLHWYPSKLIVRASFGGGTLGEDSAVHLASNPFAVAPNLRSLTTHTPDYTRMNMALPLSQLNYYEDREYLCLEVIPQLSKVVDCVLLGYCEEEGDEDEEDTVAVELPLLRTLRVRTSVLNLLRLSTPAIEALDVIADELGPLNSFLVRSHYSALVSLSITGATRLFDLSEALRLIPSLTSLRIWDGIFDSRLVRSFIIDASEPPLLPNLETLTMQVSTIYPENPYRFDPDTLFKMVESRWSPTSIESAHSLTRLTTFLFSIRIQPTPGPLSAESSRRLKEFQAQGLHIIVEIAEYGKVHDELKKEMRDNWPFDSKY